MKEKRRPLRERIAIAESGYGRDYGWSVESLDGMRMALLIDCRSEEMFWDSYEVIPVNGHDEVQTDGFWKLECSPFRVKNLHFDEEISYAIGHYDPDKNRAVVRGVYIEVGFTWWDFMRSPFRVSRSV